MEGLFSFLHNGIDYKQYTRVAGAAWCGLLIYYSANFFRAGYEEYNAGGNVEHNAGGDRERERRMG